MTSATSADLGRTQAAALATGIVVIAVSAVVLVGWAVGWYAVVRMRPGPTMGVNDAASLAAIGAAVVLGSLGRRRLAVAVGAVAAAVPVITLVQLAVGRDLGVDLVILADSQRRVQSDVLHPGRMAPSTGVALLVLALGLALITRRRWVGAAHALALAAVAVGHLSFLGRLFAAGEQHRIGGALDMAEQTAVLVVVAGLGLLCLRPEVGLPALLREPGLVGSLARRFTVLAVVVPIVAGAVQQAGGSPGRYDTAFGAAIVTLAWTAVLLGMIWWAGRSALSVELERDEALRQAADALEARDRLALVADASSAFASTLELDELLESVSVRLVDTIADACSVRLIDPTGEQLLPVMIHHRDPRREERFAELLGRSTRTDEGISGRCLDSRRPVLVADLNSRVGRPAPVDFGRGQEGAGLHSVIVVPLLAQERALGVLAVVRDQTDNPFDDRDMALVEGLAAHAAQAIDNAQLVAKQRRSDAALTEFGRRALVADQPDELEQHAVDLLQTTLSARYALMLTTGLERQLSVAATAGPADEPMVLDRGAPITAAVPLSVLATGDAAVCHDMRHDQRLGMVEMGELLATDSGMAVPVPGNTGLRGVLAVTAVGVGRFADDDLGFVRALAGILGAALDRLVAQQAVRAVAEERRALMDRLITAQEDERARIAEGMHGDQVQVITAVDLRLEVLARHVVSLAPELMDDLAFAQEAVAGAADRLRALLFELQPPDEGDDLAQAVRSVAAHLLGNTDTTWRVVANSAVPLSDGHLTMAYRIAKEALVNVGLHAQASAVEVSITDVEDGVLVSVTDDGVGMARVPDRSPAGHRGVSSMRDWAAVAGGWFEATSHVGRGTSVRFWLPNGTGSGASGPSSHAPDGTGPAADAKHEGGGR